MVLERSGCGDTGTAAWRSRGSTVLERSGCGDMGTVRGEAGRRWSTGLVALGNGTMRWHARLAREERRGMEQGTMVVDEATRFPQREIHRVEV